MLVSIGLLNAETFGISPVFVSLDDLPEYELPFSGIPPKSLIRIKHMASHPKNLDKTFAILDLNEVVSKGAKDG